MKDINNTFIKSAIALLFLCLTSISSAFVTVGLITDDDCDYHNLEDAYNDADVYVRVSSDFAYSDEFTISKTKWFIGGFDNCADASANIRGVSKSRWIGFSNRTVVRINTGSTSSIVTLDGFEISDGRNASFEGTGGIRVEGNVAFLLLNSEVHDNEGDTGGGMYIRGADARVVVSNSLIYDNTGNSDGGGVMCANSGQLTVIGDSAIKNNTTGGDGGGIYASSECQVNISSGDSNDTLQVEFGILGNTSEGQGGGIYITSGADVELTGNSQHPASIVGNVSNIDTNNVIIGGGGVYLRGDSNVPSDGTTFTGTNARIDFNVAKHAGAGIAVTAGASFTMSRADGDCWDNDKCSSISQNVVTHATGTAAAGYIYDVSTANISGTYISNNLANDTAGFVVHFVGTLRLESNLITGNSSNGQPFAAELFSIVGNNGFASNLDMYYNTIAGNNANTLFYMDGTSSQQWVKIYNSIIYDQGDIITAVGNIDPNLVLNCNYVHEIATLSAAQSAVDNYNFNPGFVDAANGDYHVVSGSLSKDLCNENLIQSNYKDLNGRTRGLDDPNVQNLRGPFDAGAYENYDNEIIFKNGFE